MKTPYRFSKDSDAEFESILKFRVNEYFRVNNVSKHGNAQLVIKTAIMFLVFAIPLGLLLSGMATQALFFFGLWVLMGIGKAGLGLNVMHDAIHGAYSKNAKVNKVMGMVLNIIGGHTEIWRLQHNVLHHTFTNIDGGDEDIFITPILRFSPNQKLMGIHRFQHIYAWILYGMMTMSKLVNDVLRAFRYRKMGLIKSRQEFSKLITDLALWKAGYLTVMLILPIVLLSTPWWWTILGFGLMHFITGFLLSVVFQSAHVMPECEFPLPDADGQMDNNFVVHQLATTTNFATGNRVLSWLIGGLNFQVEHHLFPTICHVHYHKISKIVAATAREFGIQYNSQKTFLLAILNHGRMLASLGKVQPQLEPAG